MNFKLIIYIFICSTVSILLFGCEGDKSVEEIKAKITFRYASHQDCHGTDDKNKQNVIVEGKILEITPYHLVFSPIKENGSKDGRTSCEGSFVNSEIEDVEIILPDKKSVNEQTYKKTADVKKIANIYWNKLSALPDIIYLKRNNQPGYEIKKGYIYDLTPDHVVFGQFKKDNKSIEQLVYLRNDVARIELSKDNKNSRAIADRFWNGRSLVSGVSENWLGYFTGAGKWLPEGLLLGVLITIAIFIVITAILQAYQRFVLESHIKRLTGSKLANEVEKLRIELMELRNKLGISTEEPKTLTKEPTIQEFTSNLRHIESTEKQLSSSITEIFGELHFVSFIRSKIFGLLTEDKFNNRKQQRIQKWERNKKKYGAWIKISNFVWSITAWLVLLFGWFCVVGIFGNFFMFISEPAYLSELGIGVFFALLVMTYLLIFWLGRLHQALKIRKAAYEVVFELPNDEQESDNTAV